MLLTRIAIIALLLLSLTSCTTQKAINETGKEIDKGNYGVATWYVATLPVVMLYDVFTLGGTSDVETGYNTVTSIANKNSSSGISHASTSPSNQATPMPASGSSGSSGSSAYAKTSITSQPASQQPVSSPVKSYPGADHCLIRDSTSNSLADFWINSCSFAVTVMWFDTNDCTTGCMTGVGANSRESVSKGKAGSTYTSVACPKPSSPKGPDGVHQWANEGRHQCTF
ncbi:TPA: hypothetical protein I8Y09_003478 [Raoultella ornithinolytica]|nr:hypothetical protein [Raoultella ornithinolytica]